MDRPATGTHPLPGTRCVNLLLLVAVVGGRRAMVICDGRGTGLAVRVRRSEPVTDVLPSTPTDRRDRGSGPLSAAALRRGPLGGGLAVPPPRSRGSGGFGAE